MATPPVTPAVRCRLKYIQSDSFLGGSRFYLSYTGSAPSPANCVTLAGDIEAAWVTHLAAMIYDGWTLNEVDVMDLASEMGASGQWTGSESGTRSGSGQAASVATNIEFNIARRYRGGKPRIFFPGGAAGDLATLGAWTSEYVDDWNTAIAAFFAEIEALSIGSMGTLQHVNISFYQGVYTTSPPWRGPGYKYPPKYRTTPLVDNVSGYATKTEVGSQKRRREATTP